MNIEVGKLSGSDATNELHETIKTFVESSNNQSQKMINLTWAIVGLTIIMAFGLAFQVYMQLNKEQKSSKAVSTTKTIGVTKNKSNSK